MYRIFLFRPTFFILYISLRLTFLNMDNMDMNDDDSQIFTNKGKKWVITSPIFRIIFKKANEFEATVLPNITFAAESRLWDSLKR